ncbi:hypothetical protein SSCG_02403 [Streptomyces clavuligerus]|nr:hypothetical protein SSCG_02403 [Streptomyces clavuligerus]
MDRVPPRPGRGPIPQAPVRVRVSRPVRADQDAVRVRDAEAPPRTGRGPRSR